MEIAREVEYQRRSKQLRRICREYNLTEGRISGKLLGSDILIDHQLNVCISVHKNNHNKTEKPFSLIHSYSMFLIKCTVFLCTVTLVKNTVRLIENIE